MARNICAASKASNPIASASRVEAMAALLEKRGAGSGLVEPEIDIGGKGLVAVPMSLLTELERLVQDHHDAGARARERALAMLRSLAPESQTEAARLGWIARTWVEVGAWAVKELHNQTRTDDERDADEIIGRLETLERILHGVTRPFFENKDDLDALLEDTNT